MTASSYDGRKPEPPYLTDSDIVVDLQEQIDALTEERDELRSELQRLQSSPAPVVGGVPELTRGEAHDLLRDAVDFALESSGNGEVGYGDIIRFGYQLAASRLSSIKPEEYAALLDFAERIVPIRDNLSGISWVGNLKDVFAAYDNWYAIRIAQATTSGEVGECLSRN